MKMQTKRIISFLVIKSIFCVLLASILFYVTGNFLGDELKSDYLNSHSNNFRDNIEINLNDGLPIFADNDVHIAPNITISSEFFITNKNTCKVYYRIYIENLTGLLSSSLIANITEKNGSEIYRSAMTDFSNANVTLPFGELDANETKILIFSVYCPKDVTSAEGSIVTFDIKAEAVMIKT